jgi:hypothetical protein
MGNLGNGGTNTLLAVKRNFEEKKRVERTDRINK